MKNGSFTSFGDWLGSAGKFLLGDSREDRQNERLNNEFRAMGPELGNIQGLRGGMAHDAMGVQAPQAGSPQHQQAFANMLFAQAQGQGPGQEIARRQAAQQASGGIQQQMAMAAGQRGGSSPLAARIAAGNAAGISAGAANAATMGGLQAQQQAVNPLMGVLGQQQQGSQFNVNAQLQNRSQQQQFTQELLRQQLAAAQTQEQGRLGRFQTIGGAPIQANSAEGMLGLIQGGVQAMAGAPPTKMG